VFSRSSIAHLPAGILQMPLLLTALPFSYFLNCMVAEHMEQTYVGEGSELFPCTGKCYNATG